MLDVLSPWGLGLGAAQETHSAFNMTGSDCQSKVAAKLAHG